MHTRTHSDTRTDQHLLWIGAVPVDAVSLRTGEPRTDAQRQTHKIHKIHIASSPRETHQVQLVGEYLIMPVIEDVKM